MVPTPFITAPPISLSTPKLYIAVSTVVIDRPRRTCILPHRPAHTSRCAHSTVHTWHGTHVARRIITLIASAPLYHTAYIYCALTVSALFFIHIIMAGAPVHGFHISVIQNVAAGGPPPYDPPVGSLGANDLPGNLLPPPALTQFQHTVGSYLFAVCANAANCQLHGNQNNAALAAGAPILCGQNLFANPALPVQNRILLLVPSGPAGGIVDTHRYNTRPGQRCMCPIRISVRRAKRWCGAVVWCASAYTSSISSISNDRAH